MAKRRRRRGVSLGTLLMLTLTFLVCAGCAVVLPKLQGSTELQLDTQQMLGALTLDGVVPELSLSDIPITVTTSEPVAKATAVPTLQPEVQQSLCTAAPTSQSFTLTLGGSICVESAVRKSAYFSESETYDFEEIMALLAPEMQSDLCMVAMDNLISPTSKVSDTIAPEAALSLLTTTGVDVVALGFANVFDLGLSGISSTLTAMRGRGLTITGAYETEEAANTGVMLSANNVKIAVLHYTDALSSTGKKKMKNEDAAYAVPLAEAETIAADIAHARQSGAEVVLVSLHWGSVGQSSPTDEQKELAQAIADAGANLIIGTGTKVVQPVVWLEGKDESGNAIQVLCAYNLGTLLSDSRKKNVYVSGVLLQLKITSNANGTVTFDKTEYTPTYAWRYKSGQYQYRVLASDSTPPDAMSEDQQEVMARALTTIQKTLADSAVTQRAK